MEQRQSFNSLRSDAFGRRKSFRSLLKVHAVIGDGPQAGRIKTIFFHKNVSSPLLRVEWQTQAGQKVGITDVRLAPEFERRGWRLLKEMYEEEGKPELYEEFLRYQEYAETGRTKRQFPAELLPAGVSQIKKEAAKFDDQWSPTVEVKREQPKQSKSQA